MNLVVVSRWVSYRTIRDIYGTVTDMYRTIHETILNSYCTSLFKTRDALAPQHPSEASDGLIDLH